MSFIYSFFQIHPYYCEISQIQKGHNYDIEKRCPSSIFESKTRINSGQREKVGINKSIRQKSKKKKKSEEKPENSHKTLCLSFIEISISLWMAGLDWDPFSGLQTKLSGVSILSDLSISTCFLEAS